MNKNKIYFKSNNKISTQNSHNRKIKRRHLAQNKTSSMSVHQNKTSLIQKCQLKFNYFLSGKKGHKSNLKKNTKNYFDDEISTNLLNIKRSNYIIKVKTKINHIGNENNNDGENNINKNGENAKEKNSDENDDNKNVQMVIISIS